MAIASTVLEPQADRFVLFLHGILGTRANWRSIARRATEVWSSRGPRVGALLVDLRMHGESQNFEPPHTVRSAAEDLRALSDELGGRPIVGVVGHSFGGKVAMTYAARTPTTLERLWVIDSAPGITPPGQVAGNTREVLRVLREIPRVWERREDFVEAAMAHGLARGIAQWLAMNLTASEPAGASRSTEGGPVADLRWPLDLDAIEALLADYGELDTWHVLEDPPTHLKRIDVIIGGDSDVWGPGDRARCERSPARLHVVEGAQHWVHVDAPDRVLELLTN